MRKCVCLLLASLGLVLSADSWGQTVQLSPDYGLYFGQIPEGTAAVRKFLVYNISTATLSVSQVQIEGPNASAFSLAEPVGSFSLGPLESKIIAVEYHPATEGADSARVKVVSNATTSPDFLPLTGRGTDLSTGQIVFERVLGTTEADGPSCIRQTSDGGFVIAGYSVPVGAEYSDALLMKIDRYGQMEWMKTYGKEGWSEGFGRVLVLQDGGYLLAGTKAFTKRESEPDIWLVRTDGQGNLQWEKTYSRIEGEAEGVGDVIQAPDGGYLLAGYSQSGLDKDIYLIKLDEQGNVQWEKVYGGDGGEGAGRILPTDDGGYIFSGSTSSWSTGGRDDYDIFVMKVDSKGDQQWLKTYGGSDWDRGGGIVRSPDGGYLLSGWTASPEYGAVARDILLIKIDADGNEQWHRVYGWDHKDAAAQAIATQDGGYLVVGSSERYYDARFEEWRADLYVLKLDGEGNLQWSKLYGRLHEDWASDALQLDDGSYLICGGTLSFSKASDIYLLRLNKWGDVATGVEAERTGSVPQSFELSQNYPNPFNSWTLVRYAVPRKCHVRLEVFDLLGKRVSLLTDADVEPGRYVLRWEAQNAATGLYFCRLTAGDVTLVRRMLLLK